MKVHKIIFWSHLLVGVVAGLVIFIMSFTGVILMYEPQIAEYSEWNQRWVTPPSPEAKRLALDDLIAKVRSAHHALEKRIRSTRESACFISSMDSFQCTPASTS